MQTRERISELLKSLEIPFYHIKAPAGVLPPLCVWYETDSRNMFADDRVWQTYKPVTIDLLTIEDPAEICEVLESAMNAEGICWQSGGPEWLDEENIYIIQYWL